MSNRSKADLFLDKYRYMENLVQIKYQLRGTDSAIFHLQKIGEFKEIAAELDYCREVRNILSHKPKLEEEYCVEPSQAMIRLIDHVIESLENPPKIMDIATPMKHIFYGNMEDNLKEAVKNMNARSFGHVPILSHGVVKGVLSEKSLMNYMVASELFCIKENMKIADIADYVMIDRRDHQSDGRRGKPGSTPREDGYSLNKQFSEIYCFVKKDAFISEVSTMFHDALNAGVRLGMVFVTQNGHPEEKLLGIITAWDIAGMEEE